MRKSLWSVVLFLACSGIVLAWDFPEIKGWSAQDEVKTYGPDDLWEHINGAAENFLSCGFELLKFQELSSQKRNVTVNIYDMGSPLNAFGIYRSEKSDEDAPVKIATEAVIFAPYQALLLKGSFYVKVDAYNGDLDEAALHTLLEAVSKALPGGDGFPAQLGLLPSAGRIPGSEGYARKGYLGLAELENCVFAKYRTEGQEDYQVFAIVAPESDGGARPFESLAEKWTPVKHKRLKIVARKVPYRGLVGVVLTEKGILGVSGAQDETELIARLSKLAGQA